MPGGPQPAAIGKAIAERGIDKNKIKVVGQGELTFDEALKGMGDAGLGFITAFHYDYNHQSAKNKKFVAAYNADFKRNPDMFSVGGYDGMHVIYEALKKTNGDTDGDKLIAAAKGMKWESPRGPMSIDPETRDVVADRLHPPRREGGRATASTSSSTRSRTSRTRSRRGCRSKERRAMHDRRPRGTTAMITSVFGVLFDGFAYGMLLFLLSVGLSVTLGMMNFVNLAHCTFGMIGGYVTVTLMNTSGLAVPGHPARRLHRRGGDQRRVRAHHVPAALPRERPRPVPAHHRARVRLGRGRRPTSTAPSSSR